MRTLVQEQQYSALLTVRRAEGGALAQGASPSHEAPSRGKRAARAAAALCTVAGLVWATAAAGQHWQRTAQAPRPGAAAKLGLAEEAPCKPRELRGGDSQDPCKPLSEEKMIGEIQAGEAAGTTCSAFGENCQQTKCCSSPGMKCYAKDAAWAECKPDCVPGPDPRSSTPGSWTCEELGTRAAGNVTACAQGSEDCSQSQCCAGEGLQCYQKSEGYAACRAECRPGVDVTDADAAPWTCRPLGHRTPGVAPWVAEACSPSGFQPAGSSCIQKGCCASPGTQCFLQNDYFGECHKDCPAGWGCKTKGYRTPQPAAQASQVAGKVADWVADQCSATGRNCSDTKCCSEAGDQCFRKNATWATCKGSCAPGPDLYDADPSAWSCQALGMRTPGGAQDPWKSGKDVAKWVASRCAKEGAEDCSESKCCRDVGKQCYQKNSGWAACLASCAPGPMPGDDDGNWTCAELGPRTHRPWSSPSLFCFLVMQPVGYEPGLVSAQAQAGAGIFGCDAYSAFSTKHFFVGVGPLGPVETVTFVPAAVVKSKDGTAGNAELFMHVWDAVRNQGLYAAADWTVKADPDAVLLADRLRGHLEPHTGESAFMVNCAKPFMPEGPMMFGALEAISRQGLQTYFDRAGECVGGLDWKSWGEDLFLNHCFDKLGVARKNDFSIYSDGVCTGVNCLDPDAAAFHPKKDIASWFGCLNQTRHPGPRSTTNQPQWFKDYMSSYAR